MKIGIMSDSHENVAQIKKAVAFFNAACVETVLHAGDIISPIMAAHLKNLKSKIIGVFGNNDGEKNLWRAKLADFPAGADIRERFARAEIDGRKILILHEPHLLDELAASQKYDFIVYGHTHEIDLRREGRTVVVNPGETCGYLNGKSTVAIIDTSAGTAVVSELDSGVECARLDFGR